MDYITATNKETGKRLIKVQGKWLPLEASATNAKGEKAYKFGGKWNVMSDVADKSKANPTEGMNTAEKFAAGMGKGMVDVGRGAAQLVGLESRQDVDQSKQRDAPLMQTGAGMAGNVAGTMVATAPALAAGGGIPGAIAVGGALGAAQPVGTGDSRLRNAAVGAAGGLVGGAIGKGLVKAGSALASRAGAPAAVGAASKAGYVVPPSMAGKGGFAGMMEGLGGKIKTAQKASIRNQQVTNNLVKESLGVPADQQLSHALLDQIRKKAGQSYEAISKIGSPFKTNQKYTDAIDAISQRWRGAAQNFQGIVRRPEIDDLVNTLKVGEMSPSDAVILTRELRSQGTANIRAGKMAADGSKLELGKAQMKASAAIENMMDDNLRATGRRGLLDQFRKDRTAIAKTYDVERALNNDTGDVDAAKLVRLLDKGRPLSGGIRQAAEFGKSFPKAAQSPAKIGGVPPISPLDVATTVMGGIKGAAAAAVRPIGRAYALSGGVQRGLGRAPSQIPLKASQAISRAGGALGEKAAVGADRVQKKALQSSRRKPDGNRDADRKADDNED